MEHTPMGGVGAPRRATVCVFCGSSHGADPVHTEAARRFGAGLAKAGFDLVFGGGDIGLMGEVARAVHYNGGHVLGIIPGFLRHLEPPMRISTKTVITESMAERKTRMFAASDFFAVLPGGLGTLDEFSEVLTAAQLRLMTKPIVLVNVKGYWTPLVELIGHFVAEGFAGAGVTELFQLAPDVDDAIRMLIDHREKAVAAASEIPDGAGYALTPSR
jgi:uncharacterized protein (TIGR00730 family)